MRVGHGETAAASWRQGVASDDGRSCESSVASTCLAAAPSSAEARALSALTRQQRRSHSCLVAAALSGVALAGRRTFSRRRVLSSHSTHTVAMAVHVPRRASSTSTAVSGMSRWVLLPARRVCSMLFMCCVFVA